MRNAGDTAGRLRGSYLHTPIERIRTYSMAQFDHWTKEPFSSNFRKMLTLEQYRDPKLRQLYHDYLATGPTEYMAAIFRKLVDSDEAAMQLAWNSTAPCSCFTAFTMAQATRTALHPCSAHTLTALLPKSNQTTELVKIESDKLAL